GDLVHLGQRDIDLIDAGRLLGAGGGDLGDDAGDALDRVDDLVERGASLVDKLDTFLNLRRAVGDQILDVVGRLRRALRQAPDLRGHHGETAAGLAGARRLDRRVERQEVGLPRDLVDDTDDVADFARRFIDARHRAHGLRHHRAAAVGDLAGAGGELVRLLGI